MPPTLVAHEKPLQAPVTASQYEVVSILVTRSKALWKALFGTPTKYEVGIISRSFYTTLKFVRGYWANLMLAGCLLAFAGIAGFATSLQDNYSCTTATGQHIVTPNDTVYRVVSMYCSGNQMAARSAIIRLNNGEAVLHPGDVLVIPSG
jgi:hypothetical protein